MNINVTIEPSLLDIFPQIRLGCLSYGARVAETNPALWAHMETEVIPEALRKLEVETLANIEGIRCSREAYKAFGRSPSRYRVSSESLFRRIRQGNELYHVNTVVDVNNLISVETGLSVGTYDCQNLEGPVALSLGKAGEGYEGIGKGFIDMENMLMLRDALGPFGSPTSDSHRAMVGVDSADFLTVIYCFSNSIDLKSALCQAAKQLENFADAKSICSWIVS